MKIDYSKLIEDVDVWSVIDRLNIETNYGIGNAYPKGKTVKVKSPFRIDNSLGSCEITIIGKFKGMFTDWTDNSHHNLVDFVKTVLNIPYWEAEEFIARDYGGRAAYFIPGTESEYEMQHKDCNKKNSQNDYQFPSMLSTSELQLIGINPYNSDALNNCIVKSCSTIPPSPLDIKVKERVVRIDIENPNYSLESEYLSFEDFINDNKNPNYNGNGEPFITYYLVVEKEDNTSLYDLYINDKFTYRNLIKSKAQERINLLDYKISKCTSLSKETVKVKSLLKLEKRKVIKLMDKFKMDDKDSYSCINEKIEYEKKQEKISEKINSCIPIREKFNISFSKFREIKHLLLNGLSINEALNTRTS